MPNHMVTANFEEFPERLHPFRSILEGRSMIVRKVKILPVECIARGYLIGSGWNDYQAHGAVCGLHLRDGYQMADQLDEPIFTPATKAESGHDMNISFDETKKIIGEDLAIQIRDATLRLYANATSRAKTRGILIADTKFEFGICEGKLVLADEALTPDSSRFWPADTYQPGNAPPSFDKQYIRDYLDALDWDKTPPAPPLPETVIQQSARKYQEAFQRLTGTEPRF